MIPKDEWKTDPIKQEIKAEHSKIEEAKDEECAVVTRAGRYTIWDRWRARCTNGKYAVHISQARRCI